ncbi:reverse transcriptase domain-containing protein [Tanacetum coccineum]
MKVARYPDFGLELLVPEKMWIDEVCTYDISATYGISHWWFNQQKFYIERHDSSSHQREVRKHMRILSVIIIKAFLRYGNFEDLNLLLLQGHLDYLPGSNKRMLSTADNAQIIHVSMALFMFILSFLAGDHVVALTPGSAITIPETANKFAIKGNHLTLVKGNQFDGRTKTVPHKDIHEFLKIYDMFKYRDTKNEVVRLMMFPLSLTGEAKTWLNELNEGTIETWDELQTTFISRFFPPALFDRLFGEIRAFSQHENESLTDAWLRMKGMLQNCHGHNLSKGNIIKIFYHGISLTQEVLNVAAGGIFLYKIQNQAYQLLEDKALLNLDWAKNQKTKPYLKKPLLLPMKAAVIPILTKLWPEWMPRP